MATSVDDTVVAGAASDDPGEGLRAVLALRLLSDRLERLHVDRARQLGWSWQDIATVLGVSKQAVHKKHGRYAATGYKSTRTEHDDV
ncbi:MAG TPA: helix-turn-helix domain-containing protein [Dermatophilaceae bacterium]|nr:helix-turn-helix domain-containing protein [Dermatophilaceae bacterium]